MSNEKTGRWIKDDPWTKPWCSECGESCIGAHGFDYVLTKHCPNCGIKMESEMELNFSLCPISIEMADIVKDKLGINLNGKEEAK